MRTFHWRPGGDLSAQVERIWGWESDPGETLVLPALLPGTGAELVFHYRRPFRQKTSEGWTNAPRFHLICGRRKAVPLASSEDLGFVSVRLRAGSLALLTDLCANAFADRLIPAALLLGEDGIRLERRLVGCARWADRAACLEEAVGKMLRRPKGDEAVCRAIDLTYRRCETATIAALADAVGVKQRSLERRVLRAAGQTLVEIRTASRVQKTIRHLLLDREAQIADSAIAYGFHDQAHFTHAMRAIGLPPPARFVRSARRMTNFYNPPDSLPVTHPWQ